MVFVAMRDHDAAEFADAVLDVANVGNDQVNPALPFFGKLATGVDDDEVSIMFDHQHALADLGHSAKWNDPQPAFGCLRDNGAAAGAACLLWRRGSTPSSRRT